MKQEKRDIYTCKWKNIPIKIQAGLLPYNAVKIPPWSAVLPTSNRIFLSQLPLSTRMASTPPTDGAPSTEPHNPKAPADVASSSEPLSPKPPADEVPEEPQKPARDPRYPLTVAYCPETLLPAELHEFVSRNQFEK